MEVIDNILTKVTNEDIIDGTFIIPDEITEIGANAFFGCMKLKNITIPESVTKIGDGAFYECRNLEKVILPKNLTIIENNAFSDCRLLKTITIPDSVIKIGESAFAYCTSLESINLPKNLKTLENSAFYKCSSIKKIEIPDSITEIKAYTFSSCTSLESVNLPKNLKTIEDLAFSKCDSLKNIVLPNGVTKIGGGAFYVCHNLEKVILPKSVTIIGSLAFENCSSIKNIVLPDNITKINKSAFKNCESLENIIIPEGVQEINESTFENCSSLKNIVLPDNITKINKSAFKNCNSLENINIPEEIQVIEESAFLNCEPLENITLHAKIDTIGKFAFLGCNNIKKLITDWGIQDIEFSRVRDIGINYLYLYANSILKEKYLSSNAFLYSNDDIYQLFKTGTLSENESVGKFKNLYYKMRQKYDINPALLSRLSLKTTKHFNLRTWNKIKEIFFGNNYPSNNIDMLEALSEMIEVFGLFEKDKNKEKRIQDFKKFMSKKINVLTNSQYNLLLYNTDSKESLEKKFEKINTRYMMLKDNVSIPKEFELYLKIKFTDKEYKKIKKLSGTYGKQINDFIKENYEVAYFEEYKLKDEYSNSEEMQLKFFENDLIGHVNYSSLHRMFDGCKKEFNEDFYNFFMENLVFILNDDEIQSNIKNIQSKFDKIKHHYLYTSGTDKITLKQALDYLENETFDYHDGNYELSQDIKKAGVSNQEAFDYYQKVFEKNDIRHLSSLVKRSNIYEIDGYTIKAELLRSDDSFRMLVGETNYTNCCQVFGGIGMAIA